MFQRAYEALQLGDSAGAEAICRRLLEDAPDSEGPLMLLALSLEAQKRLSDASEIFEKLAILFPQSAAHWINLGSIRRMRGDSARAREAYTRATEIDSHDANALFNLGLLAMDSGEFSGARDCLLRAVEHAPEDPMIRAEAANAEFACGNTGAAERQLQGWQTWSA
ncbi:MAG: tetratricopeptide repeat protein, partial [Dokdonella sp.]